MDPRRTTASSLGLCMAPRCPRTLHTGQDHRGHTRRQSNSRPLTLHAAATPTHSCMFVRVCACARARACVALHSAIDAASSDTLVPGSVCRRS